MLNFLRKIIPERSPLRLGYHKINAILAALYYRFPANHLHVISVTGTSGKSTTVELIHTLMQKSGKKVGALSGVHFHFGDEVLPNKTLRTTLRCWTTQKYLRRMVNKGLEYVILETSSHSIDQNRLWGINIDTAVLTNLSKNEHLDYHDTFADYKKTKKKIFAELNTTSRKPNIKKMMILNKDDEFYEEFAELPVDKLWTYSQRKAADVRSENVVSGASGMEFDLRVPNNNAHIGTHMIGGHNLYNVLCAICVAMAHGVSVPDITNILKDYAGVPGRLESIDEGQKFPVVVDFTYKPAALSAVLGLLKNMIEGRLIVVWGGAYSRAKENLTECAELLDKYADEIVLTTDDPGNDDPRRISGIIKDVIQREEGDRFFEIEDRYEAIRYALMTADEKDMVLVAGRGHETIQTIGKQKIEFDDREVCREILKTFVKP